VEVPTEGVAVPWAVNLVVAAVAAMAEEDWPEGVRAGGLEASGGLEAHVEVLEEVDLEEA